MSKGLEQMLLHAEACSRMCCTDKGDPVSSQGHLYITVLIAGPMQRRYRNKVDVRLCHALYERVKRFKGACELRARSRSRVHLWGAPTSTVQWWEECGLTATRYENLEHANVAVEKRLGNCRSRDYRDLSLRARSTKEDDDVVFDVPAHACSGLNSPTNATSDCSVTPDASRTT